METVSVERTIDAEPAVAIERLQDLEALMRAAGFDEAHVDDDRVRLVNHVGFATMELTVGLIEDDAALAYEQVEGIFDTMVTRYEVEPAVEGARVTAVTEFELGTPGVGALLDATVIARQRRRELVAQLESLERAPQGGTDEVAATD